MTGKRLVFFLMVTAAVMLFSYATAETPVDNTFRTVDKWLKPQSDAPQNNQMNSNEPFPSQPQSPPNETPPDAVGADFSQMQPGNTNDPGTDSASEPWMNNNP